MGVFALVVMVSPTLAYPRYASITNLHLPSHDAVATPCQGGLVVVLILAHDLVAVLGVRPQQLGRWWSGQGTEMVLWFGRRPPP
jgi:hypothetical protein